MRIVAALVVLVALLGVGAGAARAAGEQPRVLAVHFENDVNPVTADYLTGQLERAQEDGYDAVVVVLDTPGGLSESMRDIVKAELASTIPVIVYVAPDGARAASAGVWIGMAADVLAMAPQTNIGSSTPISVGGGDIPKDLKRKVVNDAVSSLSALAQEHGRNAGWAEQAVRVASNLTARQALQQNVVDVVAPDLPALLDRIDGERTIPKGFVLHTAGADVTEASMPLWDRVLDTLIDPNIITLLLSLGVLAITVELFHPGLIFPAAFGVISLVLAFFGLHVLPFSWAGILLMLAALGFFVAEVFVASHGALTAAGVASFVFGALMLFDPAGDAYHVSLVVAVVIAALFALFVALAFTKAVRARRARPQTGSDELIGQLAVVRRPLEPEGWVFVHGEMWRARAAGDAYVPAGAQVRVEAVGEGLLLEVSPDVAEPAADGAEPARRPDPGGYQPVRQV
jgi:membrane-bound serine protease (ClpP class)